MSKMFMNVKEVMEVLEVSESYAYKLMKRLNRELQAMGCQTIAGKVDRKYFYEQFYGTRSNDGRLELRMVLRRDVLHVQHHLHHA